MSNVLRQLKCLICIELDRALYRRLIVVSVLIVSTSWISIANAKQVTVVVAPDSFSNEGLEDGFIFKSTKGQEYYLYFNSDSSKSEKMAENLISTSAIKKNKICLTVDGNHVLSASYGSCKK